MGQGDWDGRRWGGRPGGRAARFAGSGCIAPPSVLPWAVTLDQYVGGAEVLEDRCEVVAAGVAPVVVGHDCFDHTDPAGSEVADCTGEERGAGRGLFVVEDLGVRGAAVVI